MGQLRQRRGVGIIVVVGSTLVAISILHQWKQFHQEQRQALQQQVELVQHHHHHHVLLPDTTTTTTTGSTNMINVSQHLLITPSQRPTTTNQSSSSWTGGGGGGATILLVATNNNNDNSIERRKIDSNDHNGHNNHHHHEYQNSTPFTSTTTTSTTSSSSTTTTSTILLPWEVKSAMPTRQCHPPLGIPHYCCLGSISSGGAVRFQPHFCRYNITAYDIFDYTKSFVPSVQEGIDHNHNHSNTTTTTCGSRSGSDVCEIVQLLQRNHWTMSFLGDSMTRQTFVGLECEIRKLVQDHHRQNPYNVTVHTVPADRTNITNRLAWDQVAWRYGLTDTVTLHITPTATTTTTTTTTIDIYFYAMYRPFDDMEEVRQVFRTSDIIVFDFGLHFVPSYEMSKFKTVMERMVQISTYYQPIRPHLLVWRETSAQHFDHPGGHYGPGIQHSTFCAPISSNWSGVRRPILEEIVPVQTSLEWNSTNSILFIPYREFTTGLFHLHNTNNYNKDRPQDCTHFCHTPYVWMPIWYHLKIGLQKFEAFRRQQQQQHQPFP